MLVKINDAGLAVNPDHVESVQPNPERGHVVVTMATGERHVVQNDYRKSSYETFDRIFAVLNGEALPR